VIKTIRALYPVYSWLVFFAYKRAESSLGSFKHGARLPECSLAAMKQELGDAYSLLRCIFLTLKSL